MFDATLLALQKNIGMRTLAHSIHVSNIANANVPGYKARQADFQDRLRDAIDVEDNNLTPDLARQELVKDAINKVTAQIYEDPNASVNGDGNSVNIDKEMTAIAKNTIGFETAVKLLNKKLALQRYVVSEGLR